MATAYFTVEHLTTKELTRFFSKVKVSTTHFYNGSPCWEWQAYCGEDGYGTFYLRGKTHKPHRITYSWLVEPIPADWNVIQSDHLCRNRPCCNPAHIEMVPPKVNVERGIGPQVINKKKTHCKHGHEFTPENTRILKNGSRKCIQCDLAYWPNRYQEKREAILENCREYRETHKDQKRETDKNYAQRNRERINEYNREWRKKNLEKVRESARRWWHNSRQKKTS